MTRTWDRFDAELTDLVEHERDRKRRHACIYCGAMTMSTIRVCANHDDLPALEASAAMSKITREGS